MISSEVDIEWSSGLKPHLQENHRALATVQFKNRCVGDSASNWHSAHVGSWAATLLWILSLVGKELVPILQRSILILSGAWILQSFFHEKLELEGVRFCSACLW
ncbi:hypothetical protein ACB094_05G043300 [Castanea mollissima]